MTDNHRLLAGAALLVLVLFGNPVAAQTSDQDNKPPSQTGTWVGGIGSLEDETLSWDSVEGKLEQDGDELQGKLKTDDGRRYSLRVYDDGGTRKIAVQRKKKRVFSCEVSDGVLVASSVDGNLPNKLMLRRIDPLPAEQLTKLSGVYGTEDGRRISFRAQGPGLAMTDFTTGMIRHLYPLGDDKFVAGPAIAIPYPVETEFQFHRDGSGEATSVTMRAADEPDVEARRRSGPRVDEFVYESFDGTKIAGSLYLPAGSGPFPAVIWVHGSGPVTRDGAGSWPLYFADLGFAVLAVDKRGVGKSSGKYNLPGGGRDNFPHMRRRAQDVAAAADALRQRDDIQRDKIGLLGASQAGWVIPMSAQHTDVAFAVILYGGATPLSVENKYSRIASENDSGARLEPVDQLIEQLRSYQPSDVGIEQELSAMEFPCLWIYGYRDRSNPSQICAELINELASRHNRNFTVQIFPNGNHGLLDCRFGGAAESRTLSQLVPELHTTIANWLAAQGLMPK